MGRKTVQERRRAISKVSAPIDKDGVFLLCEALKDRNADVRLDALLKLVDAPCPEMEIALIGVLNDPSDTIRWMAVEALGAIGTPSAAQHVARMLRDEDELVRTIAAEQLGYIRHPSAIAPLLRCLSRDESPMVRCYAAFSVASIATEISRVKQTLNRVYDRDSDDAVKLHAAAGLCLLGDNSKFGYVLNGLSSLNASVRSSAAYLLEEIAAGTNIGEVRRALMKASRTEDSVYNRSVMRRAARNLARQEKRISNGNRQSKL